MPEIASYWQANCRHRGAASYARRMSILPSIRDLVGQSCAGLLFRKG
jgi:hypothetical protein